MNAKLVITIVIVLAAIYAGTHLITPATGPQDNGHDHTHHQHHHEEAAPSKPAIGGAFSLVDQNSAPYTEENLKGKYSLVFFGFTHCPDMCPMALSNITNALELMLPEHAERITPVLISVDPKRDTPEVLKEYAAGFHPSLVALTGSQEQVNEAAATFKVYHQVADPSVKDYMVNHSGFIYLMDTDGEYVKHFSHTTPPEEMAVELEQIVR